MLAFSITNSTAMTLLQAPLIRPRVASAVRSPTIAPMGISSPGVISHSPGMNETRPPNCRSPSGRSNALMTLEFAPADGSTISTRRVGLKVPSLEAMSAVPRNKTSTSRAARDPHRGSVLGFNDHSPFLGCAQGWAEGDVILLAAAAQDTRCHTGDAAKEAGAPQAGGDGRPGRDARGHRGQAAYSGVHSPGGVTSTAGTAGTAGAAAVAAGA